jgi:hypothetical protein
MDDEAQPFIAEAALVEPLAEPEPAPAPPRPAGADARRALALGILGLFSLGVIFGPLALALGQRARLRLVGEPHPGDAGLAHLAVTLGKVALALHLAVWATVIPWLLFITPLMRGK